MKISGFSFVKNAFKLYYPIVESIKSILPMVDEFVIAVGKGDDGEPTREKIAEINDPKIKIIDTVWQEEYMKGGIILAKETDIAKEACSGDWLFYIQADEVVHEEDLPKIHRRCEELFDNEEVEGLLFKYLHFWGDYNHYHNSHGWYPHEIRIIRNIPEIHSYGDAQSFRKFNPYDNPRQKEGTEKLKVAEVDARIFHYGWVRPPQYMQTKNREFHSNYWGKKRANEYYDKAPKEFDFGPLDRLTEFQNTHPMVMQERIKEMYWADKLQYSGKPNKYREPHKHEKFKYRLTTWVEKTFYGRKEIGGFKNYIKLKNV